MPLKTSRSQDRQTPRGLGHASLAYSYAAHDGDPEYVDYAEALDADLIYDPDTDAEDHSQALLSGLGDVDSLQVIEVLNKITERYLSDIESNLIWLMLKGRRPVEISRILHIPECEVVRLRRNCFRKIRTVYLYDFHHDKAEFLASTTALLALNPKQERIFTMFFNYYGLRQIAETIGTRPSNIHRSLQMMRRKLQAIAEGDPEGQAFDHFYLNAFKDFKYLCLKVRGPA
jgi:hypothetical protein